VIGVAGHSAPYLDPPAGDPVSNRGVIRGVNHDLVQPGAGRGARARTHTALLPQGRPAPSTRRCRRRAPWPRGRRPAEPTRSSMSRCIRCFTVPPGPLLTRTVCCRVGPASQVPSAAPVSPVACRVNDRAAAQNRSIRATSQASMHKSLYAGRATTSTLRPACRARPGWRCCPAGRSERPVRQRPSRDARHRQRPMSPSRLALVCSVTRRSARLPEDVLPFRHSRRACRYA